jgi:hypothetical protein
MSSYLNFHFNVKNPENRIATVVISEEPNYIAHSFLQIPIYDNFDVEIGYKISDDYIQQIGENQYIVRINSTYHIKNKGTISWFYSFLNDKPNFYYPLNVPNASNITSTTGDYFGKTGAVSLTAYEDGNRDVTIVFNF